MRYINVYINVVYHYIYTVCILRVIMSTGKNTKLTIGDKVGRGQWLNLPAWKVGDRGLEPHSGLQV